MVVVSDALAAVALKVDEELRALAQSRSYHSAISGWSTQSQTKLELQDLRAQKFKCSERGLVGVMRSQLYGMLSAAREWRVTTLTQSSGVV